MNSLISKKDDIGSSFFYAYSHTLLAENSHYDAETEFQKAFEKLEKAIQMAENNEIIALCVELVNFHQPIFEKLTSDRP